VFAITSSKKVLVGESCTVSEAIINTPSRYFHQVEFLPEVIEV
jgi:hypothetical protein